MEIKNMFLTNSCVQKIKKGVCLTLAPLTFMGLTSCNGGNEKQGKKAILEGTMLNKTVVAEFSSGESLVLKPYSTAGYHLHYVDILTNAVYHYATSSDEKLGKDDFSNGVQKLTEDTLIKPIDSYLTIDEVNKAVSNTLTEEDIVKIIFEINSGQRGNKQNTTESEKTK